MDARLDLLEALGLAVGDAHVLRNAGGVVSDDVIRSLAISQRKLGTRAVMLIHHTRCGMQDAHRRRLPGGAAGGHRGGARVRDRVLQRRRSRRGPVAGCACGVRRSSPFRDDVRGFVYDVDSRRLREVEADGAPRLIRIS